MPTRLRVAVLLDAVVLPAWIRRVLAELEASDVAELVAAVFVTSPGGARAAGWVPRAYRAIDRGWFALPNDPGEPADASALLRASKPLHVTPHEASGVLTLAAGDLEILRAERLDVLLKLGAPPLAGEILGIARLGMWSFDHLEKTPRGGAPFFAAMARNAPATETCLRADTPDGSHVLARSWAATDPTSLARGTHFMLWKSAAFVRRALRDAAASQPMLRARVESSAPDGSERSPSSLDTFRLMGRVGLRVARERWRGRSAEDVWLIGIRRSRGSLVDGPIDGFRPLPMPADRFYADPVLVEDVPRLWLFFEDAARKSGKGVIRCAELRADGGLGESRVVLERDYHLSYPFVFRQRGAWFMLPETQQNRSVELWRAVEFPWRWELEKVLLRDVVAVDPTLLEHDGRLWLFAGVSESGGSLSDELFLFAADELRGAWRPHPRNPVVSDVRHARPAGPLFHEEGQLYRPGQDCSGRYGAAFWIHRVERLDEREYRETPVRRVGADWWPGLLATHSISRAGGFDATDGRLWLKRGRALLP